MLTKDWLSGGTVKNSPDLERVLALPRRNIDDVATEQLVDEMTDVLKRPEGTMRLRKLQALALLEIAELGGAFIPVTVGGGKSLVSLLAPYVLQAKRPALLAPAGLLDKTEKERDRLYSKHWLVPTNISMTSYELLGRADRANTLEDYPPDVIIADEAHRLKNADAAVTKRVLRYMENHPDTLFIALSGTVMDHSLLEFAHILRWCLKGRAPVPISEDEVVAWASAVDVKAPRGNEFARYNPGALSRLADQAGIPASGDEQARARQGFRARLTSTPGVVASMGRDEDVKASLRVKAIVYAPTKKEQDPFEEDYHRLRARMKLSDDWPLTTPMEVWAKSRELAMDLFYAWDPRPPEWWSEPRKAWFKFVRKALADSSARGGSLDSPAQVEAAVIEGLLPGGVDRLAAWKKVEKDFTYDIVPLWRGDLAVNAVKKWVKSSGPGIVWVEHTLFAQRLAEATGLKYYVQGGRAADGERIEDADPKRSVIASVDANKEGRNLQGQWSRNLITSIEGRPGINEQLIGRTHRAGQESDEVHVDILVGCLEHLNAWRDLIPAARAVRDTTGAEQKILLADVIYWPSDEEVSRWTGARWVVPDAEDDDEDQPLANVPYEGRSRAA